MEVKPSVNSLAYWDRRFRTDWEDLSGPIQSKFFTRLALQVLPSWLLEQIRRNKLTVVDWGCAQGDGTDVWASHVAPGKLYGVDFSTVAIQQAKNRYPAIKFDAKDWLSNSTVDGDAFDVVYCSNTIEHFHNPLSIMEALAGRAEKALIFVLPFREIDRHEEHFFTFLPESIPVAVSDFRLVCSRVVDCAATHGEIWNGEQVVLVYAQNSWIESLQLQLCDFRVEHVDADSIIKHSDAKRKDALAEVMSVNQLLSERDDEIANLLGQINLNTQEIADLSELIHERDFSLETLQQQLSELGQVNEDLRQVVSTKNSEITSLNSSLRERESRLIRLTAELDDQVAHAGRLQASLTEREVDIQVLTQFQSELQTKVDDLSHEGERLRAELIRMSDWAAHINRSPVVYAIKRGTLKTCRVVYRVLPFPLGAKTKLRSKFFRLVHPFRRSFHRRPNDTVESHTDRPLGSLSNVMGGHRDVLMFAVIDWDFRVQRPQHLARQLAKSGRRVFYFSNHFIDGSEPGYQIERVADEPLLHVVHLHVSGAPQIYFDVPSDAVRGSVSASIVRLLSRFKIVSSTSLIQHPFWYPAVERLPNTVRVYDCMDDHAGFGNVPSGLSELELQMLKGVDLVIATSTLLANRARQCNPRVALIRNAVDYEHFSTKPSTIYEDPKGRRILGYYGAIADWFDVDLVRKVACAFPDCVLLLLGSDTVGAAKKLSGIPNISFIGEVPYTDLPFYLYAFDVCLVPFKRTALTQATNPVKVYEYLAAGKPVVSVSLPELEFFLQNVLCGDSAEEFIRQVRYALIDPKSKAHAEVIKRQSFSASQTWHHRLLEFDSALTDLVWPKISAVILTHNNLELTKSCLESVLNYTDYPNLEVIVVDNASADQTPRYLKNLEQNVGNLRVVLNSENRGFAAGNNIGLARATGDYLVLMNNDTVVTWGWALTMLRHFEQNPDVGLVGPVTNNIGNEARVDVRYQNVMDMPLEAFERSLCNMGSSFPLSTAAFYFVMLPREVYAKCGPLCEEFGLGYFEDDDYCRRVESIGKKIVCAEDVFVHHHLSASFGQFPDKDRLKLFEKNRAIYETKWGSWKPHQYRS